MTVEQWLQLDKESLALELGRVFTPKEEWNHDIIDHVSWENATLPPRYMCSKCNEPVQNVNGKYVPGIPGGAVYTSDELCSVPDKIKVDWNTAMEWRDKVTSGATTAFMSIMYDVYEASPCSGSMEFTEWMAVNIQASDMLIAAAMVAERSKE